MPKFCPSRSLFACALIVIVPLCTSNPICSTGFHLYCNKIASREQLKVQRLHIDSAREYKQSSLLLHTNKSTSESAQHNQLTWTEAGFTFSTSLGRSVYIATLTFQSTTFVLLVMRKGNSFSSVQDFPLCYYNRNILIDIRSSIVQSQRRLDIKLCVSCDI